VDPGWSPEQEDEDMALDDFEVVQFHHTAYFAISKSLKMNAGLQLVPVVVVACIGHSQRARRDGFNSTHEQKSGNNHGIRVHSENRSYYIIRRESQDLSQDFKTAKIPANIPPLHDTLISKKTAFNSGESQPSAERKPKLS
jgi:hypothetical protein